MDVLKMVDLVKKNKFLQLIDENQHIIHKICSLYTVNEEDRKDLSQEIVYQLWKSYQSFKGDSKFTTWMYRVALNTALLNLRRDRFRNRTRSLKEHHANIQAETTGTEKKENISQLYTAINQLRQFDRAIILLYLEQLSYSEIANVTGVSQANVSVRLVRIKKKLKELLNRGL